MPEPRGLRHLVALEQAPVDEHGKRTADPILWDCIPTCDLRDDLLARYRPNVGQGNYQADVAARGRNEMVAMLLRAIGVPDERIAAAFKRRDEDARNRSQAAIAHADARAETPTRNSS